MKKLHTVAFMNTVLLFIGGVFQSDLLHAEVLDMNAPNEVKCVQESGDPEGKIHPFNYDGVELLDGRLKDQFEQVKEFYCSMRSNDILKSFRSKAGQDAPGREMYGTIGFGQWLSAFARMYKVTGDNAIRDKAVYLMDEWAKTLEGNDRFGHYSYEKMAAGLLDMHEYIGSEKALEYLDTITDWAEKNLDRSNPYALPSEWYTLSEPLYHAYKLTGDKRYYDFGKVWEYTDFWGILARNEDVFQEILKTNPKHESYHGYSHVNCLSSAAMAYKVTGKQHYLDAIVNGYDFMQNSQCYATGGYGPEEQFVVPDGLPETLVGIQRGEANVNVRFHFETSCGSWAGFKICRYLQTFTGEARYGDWMERLVYNGVGAMIPMNDYGMIMYGSKYHLFGAEKSLFTVWFCCQGSLPQTVTDYHNLIYYYDKDNLYVNLFVPSKVDWNGPDGKVTVVQETQFPESETVNLTVNPKKTGRFGIKFRVPQWAHDGVKVQVNGAVFETATVPGTWGVIERNWESGDTVRLDFDLSPRVEPVPGCVSPAAIMCGPVVMVRSTARDEEDSIPSHNGLTFPSDWLMGEDPKLTYSISPSMKLHVDQRRKLHTNQVLRPYYDIRAGEYYRMYFIRAGEKSILTENIAFEGDWETEGTKRYAQKAGSYFEFKTNRSNLVWEGLRHMDAGIASVSIDGKEVAQVDQYGYTDTHVGRLDQREVPFRWSISNIGSGEHTIRITVTKNKNDLSKGTTINVSKLIAYP